MAGPYRRGASRVRVCFYTIRETFQGQQHVTAVNCCICTSVPAVVHAVWYTVQHRHACEALLLCVQRSLYLELSSKENLLPSIPSYASRAAKQLLSRGGSQEAPASLVRAPGWCLERLVRNGTGKLQQFFTHAAHFETSTDFTYPVARCRCCQSHGAAKLSC
jgi:hypothetical protein